MAYSATVPADNLYIKDIPAAIREKGKELAAITEGYPPVVNADKVDGYDTSLTPAANVILVTDEDGKLPASSVDFGANVLAGSGLEIAEEDPAVESVTIAMQTPLTCTGETENAFPEGGGHTHKIEFEIPESAAPAFVFYEKYAGYEMTGSNLNYTLIKTFTIPIPAAGLYIFDASFHVDAWTTIPGTSYEYDCVKVTMDGTMVFGKNSGIYEEELCSQVVGMTDGENPTEIYESNPVSKNPSISGRMVYFSDSGDKLFKVYIKGFNGFKISNFCLGVIGAGTAA